MIYTFYSFKGGVGRSMALANIAELYFRRGASVLIIDFDLEAPGLERFFEDAGLDLAGVLRARGVLDLLLSYKTLRSLPQLTDGPGQAEQPNLTNTPLSIPRPFIVEPLQNFIVPIYRDSGNGASLSIMPAGRRDDDEYSSYAHRIRAFDWEDFYVNWDGEQFFDWFAKELDTLAKVVLIDSRTGITEMSGVCTHQLADAVVQFVAPNQQNVDGVKRMARSLAREDLVTKGRKGRKLSQVIIPSRIEPGEGDKLDAFAELFERELSEYIDKRLGFESTAFVGLRIPYVQHYAYMETVAVREPDRAKSIDLVAAYSRIAAALVELADPASAFYKSYHHAEEEPAGEADRPLPLPSEHVDRPWALERIGAWLAMPGPAAMILTGPPGSGKSALLARVQQLGRDASVASEGRFPDVIFTFSCRGTPGEDKLFVAALARQLAARYPSYTNALVRAAANGPVIVRVEHRNSASSGQGGLVSLQGLDLTNASTELAFHIAIATPLRQILADRSDRVLLIVDSLDAATRSSDSVVHVLAMATQRGVLPQQLRLLVGTRQDPYVLHAIEGDQLDLGDDTASGVDVAFYVEKRLESLSLAPQDRSAITQLVLTRAEGNFLYAKLVLDSVLDGPRDPQTVRARADALIRGNAPGSLREYWRIALRQAVDYDSPRWREVYRPLLAILAVAKDALSISQLAGMVGRSRSDTTDAIRTLRQFLSGEAEGQFRIFHASFTEFLIANDEYGIDAGEAHQAVARYLTDTYEDDWRQCDDLYALRYTIDHLTDAIRLAPDRGSRRPLEAKLAGAVNADFVEAVLAHGLMRPLSDSLRWAVSVVTDSAQQRELNQWLSFVDAESTTFANWSPIERPNLFRERWGPQVAERAKEIDPALPSGAIRQGRAWEMMFIIFGFTFAGRLLANQAIATGVSESPIIVTLRSMVATGLLFGLIAAGVGIALRRTFRIPTVPVELAASLVAVAGAISSFAGAQASNVLGETMAQLARPWLHWTLITAAVLVSATYFRRLGIARIARVSLAAGVGAAIGESIVPAIVEVFGLSPTGTTSYLDGARDTMRWTGLSLAVLCFTQFVPWRERLGALARISGAAMVAYGIVAVTDGLTEHALTRLGISIAIVYSVVCSVGATCAVRLVTSGSVRT